MSSSPSPPASPVILKIIAAIVGRAVGEDVQVVLDAGDAIGLRVLTPPHRVERSRFPTDPAVGEPFTLPEEEGRVYWVAGMEGDYVLGDVNHPNAGYRIRIDGQITAVHPVSS